MAEDAPELARLRERYPGWRFWPRQEGDGYAARRSQAPAVEEPIQAGTVEQLAGDVAERERQRQEAQRYVDAVERGMRAYFASRARREVARNKAMPDRPAARFSPPSDRREVRPPR
ncbi:MAG: hypothetical protein ACM3ML_08790 [Micromonosporaceae bacterium]